MERYKVYRKYGTAGAYALLGEYETLTRGVLAAGNELQSMIVSRVDGEIKILQETPTKVTVVSVLKVFP